MTEAEFANLVEDIRPELVRIAARRGGRDQAEDAVQKAVLQIWQAGKWQAASREVVSGWLRQRSKDRGRNEMRGLTRLRDAQRNLGVLGDKGGKQVKRQRGADGQADELQQGAQRRQEREQKGTWE